MSDTISRQAAIDEATRLFEMGDCYCDRASIVGMLNSLPSAQPETYKEKLKEIADALSEKFAYMNTCLNERDIILGYLGVKRPSKTHCNTDCTNIKCESYRYNKRLPSSQPLTAYVISDEDGNIKCSNCGSFECWGNYCMNCGAKMRGENNG